MEQTAARVVEDVPVSHDQWLTNSITALLALCLLELTSNSAIRWGDQRKSRFHIRIPFSFRLFPKRRGQTRSLWKGHSKRAPFSKLNAAPMCWIFSLRLATVAAGKRHIVPGNA